VRNSTGDWIKGTRIEAIYNKTLRLLALPYYLCKWRIYRMSLIL
jgi:hypothetical protein